MKKLVYGIIALTFVFTVSFTLNVQADGVEKDPQSQTLREKGTESNGSYLHV